MTSVIRLGLSFGMLKSKGVFYQQELIYAKEIVLKIILVASYIESDNGLLMSGFCRKSSTTRLGLLTSDLLDIAVSG